MAGWSGRPQKQNGRRVSRPVGCLLWLIALLIFLILVAVLFGGFQQGTKVTGSPASMRQVTTPGGAKAGLGAGEAPRKPLSPEHPDAHAAR